MSAETKLLLVKSDGMEDWYCIEREEAPGAHTEGLSQVGANSFAWLDSARISDACVEGPLEHMKGIAAAIRARGQFSERRCAVTCIVGNGTAEFWSPRNSQRNGVATLAAADDLATQIEAIS